MEENMRPTTATHDNVFEFQALLHPGTVFEHPKDVVAHPDLTLAEKRAILASWASDASAIASCPALRAPKGLKAPVNIGSILEALANWTAARETRPVASQIVASPRRAFWPPEEDHMEDIRLPRTSIHRLEYRWASRLQQDAKTWNGKRSGSVRCTCIPVLETFL